MVALVSNNEELCQKVQVGRLVEGSSLDVLIRVRDGVHRGDRLLTHPLCGNLRPYQQPFRSVLIEEHPGSPVDVESLSLIEDAIAVYQSCEGRLLLPGKLSADVRADYAFIDAELMKESLERYGQLQRNTELLRPASLKILN